MALSNQKTPTSTLDAFLAWAVAEGYSVGENPRYGTKRVTKSVHAKGSFHYDGLAADINAGTNGPAERAKLLTALTRAQAAGLAVTFARDGLVGSAKNHQNHLHVDVGEWSNLGTGLVRAAVIAPHSDVLVVGAKGPAVEALQRRLNRDYPAYSNLVPDGDYGPRTKDVVAEFQRRAGLVPDGEAGPRTFAALGL